MSGPPVFKIIPGIQSYDWGKKGSDSLAAQLAEEGIPGFQIDENKPYAEVRDVLPTFTVRRAANASSFLEARLKSCVI